MTAETTQPQHAEHYARLLDCLDSAIEHLDADDEADRQALQALFGAKSYALRLNTRDEKP